MKHTITSKSPHTLVSSKQAQTVASDGSVGEQCGLAMPKGGRNPDGQMEENRAEEGELPPIEMLLKECSPDHSTSSHPGYQRACMHQLQRNPSHFNGCQCQ